MGGPKTWVYSFARDRRIRHFLKNLAIKPCPWRCSLSIEITFSEPRRIWSRTPPYTTIQTIIAVRAGVYLEQALAGPEFIFSVNTTEFLAPETPSVQIFRKIKNGRTAPTGCLTVECPCCSDNGTECTSVKLAVHGALIMTLNAHLKTECTTECN